MKSVLAAIIIIIVSALPARAQHSHVAAAENSAATEFAQQVQENTTRFRQLDAAIAAGYRLVGPDFPGMGEHWVNIRQVMARRVDPARPAVLSYLRVEGEPVLTGAAFAVPLRDGDPLPELGFPVEWHHHGGSILEETLHLNPHAMEHEPEGPNLAMIHAWVWTENPAGTFAQQNWTLPFRRLALDPPEGITPAAGKAAHLAAADGPSYYAAVIARAGQTTDDENVVIARTLERHRGPVLDALNGWSEGDLDDSDLIDALENTWRAFWAELLPNLSDAAAERLRPLSL